jgi:putative ribosome biogenesis GTPase RsgA
LSEETDTLIQDQHARAHQKEIIVKKKEADFTTSFHRRFFLTHSERGIKCFGILNKSPENNFASPEAVGITIFSYRYVKR